jgi:hypothetical protein
VVTPPITSKPAQPARVRQRVPRAVLWLAGGGALLISLVVLLIGRQLSREPARVAEGAPPKPATVPAKPPKKTEDVVPVTVPPPTTEPPPKEAPRIPWEKNDAFDAWCKHVRSLPLGEQDKEVAAELKRRNPGFHGLVTTQIVNGAVTSLQFPTDKILDLAPVRALTGLKSLSCAGSGPGKSQLADLTPLKDLALVLLNVEHTKVADLTPLRGMPLEFLYLQGTPVTDLAPIKALPLKELRCDFRRERDADILRSMKTLQKINDEPAETFWSKAGKL